MHECAYNVLYVLHVFKFYRFFSAKMADFLVPKDSVSFCLFMWVSLTFSPVSKFFPLFSLFSCSLVCHQQRRMWAVLCAAVCRSFPLSLQAKLHTGRGWQALQMWVPELWCKVTHVNTRHRAERRNKKWIGDYGKSANKTKCSGRLLRCDSQDLTLKTHFLLLLPVVIIWQDVCAGAGLTGGAGPHRNFSFPLKFYHLFKSTFTASIHSQKR